MFQSRELQILDTDSQVEDQREEAGNEKTTHRRKNIGKCWGKLAKRLGCGKHPVTFRGQNGSPSL